MRAFVRIASDAGTTLAETSMPIHPDKADPDRVERLEAKNRELAERVYEAGREIGELEKDLDFANQERDELARRLDNQRETIFSFQNGEMLFEAKAEADRAQQAVVRLEHELRREREHTTERLQAVNRAKNERDELWCPHVADEREIQRLRAVWGGETGA